MSTNTKNDSSSPSSSPTSSKGKKPLSDITNTVLSSSPPRGAASPSVAGSSRSSAPLPALLPSAPLPAPLPVANEVPLGYENGPYDSALADSVHRNAVQTLVLQEWRRTVQLLNDLEPQLSNQYLAPERHMEYRKHYEQLRVRERSLSVELSRVTSSAPDPDLAMIHSAWHTYNMTQQAAFVSYQETQRAGYDTYRAAMAA